ncbi:heptaprenyl diphosphate synthase component 1 [Bacillus rubiinfantis]|uniref:heptaprenyl diphosphate synthase component 1 n=1 Tax=Bacillus rubiinfantis TaxID=1499680 RepID=UPI000A41BE17|nr:heptaprenyl diphosphate synthase component 1 [Bacillus rubiinfantis]
MSVQDIRQTFISIKEKVETYVFDQYLVKYIDTPVIDEDKLLILISIMSYLNLPYRKLENLALSTTLIQTALDTHEHIAKLNNEKSRQLTVLAGDYFSGLYYKFLADAEEILLIGTLSDGVKEVNEFKISVYHHESDHIEKLMHRIKRLESSLIARLADYFHMEAWNELIADVLLFKRLLHEKQQYMNQENSIVFNAIANTTKFNNPTLPINQSQELRHKLLKTCDQYLDRSKQTIETGVRKIPFLNEFLESRIASLLKQHQIYVNTFREEG